MRWARAAQMHLAGRMVETPVVDLNDEVDVTFRVNDVIQEALKMHLWILYSHPLLSCVLLSREERSNEGSCSKGKNVWKKVDEEVLMKKKVEWKKIMLIFSKNTLCNLDG